MKTSKFKMTELGPMPVDWEVKRLGDVSSLITKGTTPTSVGCDFECYGINFIKAESISDNGDFIPEKFAHIDEHTDMLLSRSKLKKGDFLFSIAGVLGRVALVTDEVLPANTNQALAVIRLGSNNIIDKRYLFFALKSEYLRFRVKEENVAAAQANLSLQDVNDFHVALPPLAEQQRIARALSDVDELISALGKLIEKKRNIKTGAMQELLTGKTRLPGFGAEVAEYKMTELGHIPVDWEMKRLGDVAKIGNGKDYKHLPEGNVPVYGTGGLMTYVNACLYDGATVCIGRKGTIDEPQYHEGKIWTVDTLFYTYDFKGVDPKFLYYLFTRINWHSYNSATGVPSLTAVTILGIDILLPPLAEQKAIAAVLSDIDAEIAALEAKRAKYESIKQGMMQELLTGKTRLKGE